MDASYSIAERALPETDKYFSGEQNYPKPAIGPGRICVFECLATSLSPLHAEMVGRADVVLYEPALAPLVARDLPIGTYAEKLPPAAAADPAISARAVQLAGDGWSVVQLVEARRGWRDRLRSEAEGMTAPDRSGGLRLLAIGTAAADRQRQWPPPAADLAGYVADLRQDELLTLVFGPRTVRHPTPGRAFTANGLAG